MYDKFDKDIVLEPSVEKLLQQRYYKTGENWFSLVKRIVDNVCQNETDEYKESVFELIFNRVFLPNSPCLVNAGTRNQGLLACFTVTPTEDDLGAHIDSLKDIALVAKHGGGCGFAGTFFRPKNSPVAGSAHGYSYGPNAWAIRVSEYMDMITQSGFRKMALMYNLRSDHPDLDEYIELKQNGDEKFAYNFNQSVMATDEWMEQAQIEGTKENEQFLRLCKNAWNNGEPGLMFYDTINNNTPYKMFGETIAQSNPCSEQLLPSHLACVLASINISHDYFFENDTFQIDKLEYVSTVATRFLDNIGDANSFPSEKFKQRYEGFRPIGLGIMGYADALLKQKMRYGNSNALQFLEQTIKHMYRSARDESVRLGVVKGIPSKIGRLGRRNVTLVSIAPTGSIGFISNCSHSIEPIFSPSFMRTDERGETYFFEHPLAKEDYFSSAINIDKSKIVTPDEHLDTQIVAQKHCDSGISKTVNLPNDTTVDDIKEIFIKAWQNGCKGITVYRDGSRQIQVLESKEEDSFVTQCKNGVCEL